MTSALPRDLGCRCRGAARCRAGAAGVPRHGGVSPPLLAVYDRLLDRFMPPSFLVDEHGLLVDTFGGVESLLEIKARRPSQNLLDMLDDDMRTVVSGALHRVRRDAESVRYPCVAFRARRRVSIVAEPLRDPHGALTHVLISLVDAERSGAAARAAVRRRPGRAARGDGTVDAAAG